MDKLASQPRTLPISLTIIAAGLKQRLLSLDVLRGITIVGMIVVNNAGGRDSYEMLRHSAWDGLTPCDLVFPFFLFIMGVTTYMSLSGTGFRFSAPVAGKIMRRTLLILLIGCQRTGRIVCFRNRRRGNVACHG